jgi:DNA mismatch repair protein MutL
VPIQILAEEVALAIAAGEVVERPVSVVKELIENALDAGARNIEVNIERGGQTLIEVADDGMGIPTDEVSLALERFSTSKLENREDLFEIHTLGFRGEALASIAAVSRFEIITRAQNQERGTQLLVEGGKKGKARALGAPSGTVIRVRDLFFNVPARKKFLKTEATERRRISTLVNRYAIVYPEVRFQLSQGQKVIFRSAGKGNRREVLAAVYGIDTAQQMIRVETPHQTKIQISGFISPPSVHRASRRELTFFVNGRLIQDTSLSTAVLQAYQGFLMVGRYPMVFLVIDLPPKDIDVNVHPTKSEIRFRERDVVFSILQRVVRATLLGQAPPSAIEFTSRWKDEGWADQDAQLSPDWLLTQRTFEDIDHTPLRTIQPILPDGTIPLLRAVGQVGAAYLVAEGPDGLYLLDQHAAHERILFEAYMRVYQEEKIESQALLEPAVVEFTTAQAELLEERLVVLRQLGFDVESFGKNAYRLRSLPSILGNISPENALRAVVDEFEEDESPLASEVEARIVARVCKRASIKAGQVLSLVEQRQLIRDLEACQAPRTCPHGRPTMIHLSVDALERQFGRRG